MKLRCAFIFFLQRLEMGDYDVPLVDLGLVPSAVMTFAWHPEVAEEVSQQVRHVYRYQLKGGPQVA